ncbi:MAG TPA: STAS domain-containing protein, partial [Planctomycetota bacterium]|nr:STAS domain-containing protein [Planctomycetota bacterium]
EQGGITLTLDGDIDAYTFVQLQQEIHGLLERGFKLIRLDLSGVRCLTSSGAGVLINAHGEADCRDAKLILLRPSRNVREVLDILGLAPLFWIEK